MKPTAAFWIHFENANPSPRVLRRPTDPEKMGSPWLETPLCAWSFVQVLGVIVDLGWPWVRASGQVWVGSKIRDQSCKCEVFNHQPGIPHDSSSPNAVLWVFLF